MFIFGLNYMLMIFIINIIAEVNFPPTKFKFYMRAISLTSIGYNFNKGILS